MPQPPQEYYLAQQVHPVVARLCSPIQVRSRHCPRMIMLGYYP